MKNDKVFPSFPIQDASKLLAALANPVRLKAVRLLLSDEWTVTSLARAMGISQSALSQHLKILRDAKLVSTRKVAQTVYYSSHSREAGMIIKVVNSISQK